MINGMYLSTMGAMIQSTQHGLVANNLANSETAGYKPDYGTFRELLAESALQPGWRPEINELLEKTGGGVWMNQTAPGFAPGNLQPTGDPLNAAIRQQNGFFQVRKGDELYLTRDGAFNMNGEGQLVMADGETPVLDANGAALTLTGSPEILADGTIVDTANNNAILGQVALVQVDDLSKLKKNGENLYALNGANTAAGGVTLEGRAVEGSAVDPVREMAAMIEASRAYQMNMKFVTIQDDTLGRTVNVVGSTRG
ncbi:MAG: flagellar hook-basal body protein [Planctomycetota bacterium]